MHASVVHAYVLLLQKFFRKKPVKELLPVQPVDGVVIEPWWIVQAGYITEDDVKVTSCPVAFWGHEGGIG